jgi:hypothetical protein
MNDGVSTAELDRPSIQTAAERLGYALGQLDEALLVHVVIIAGNGR